MATKRALLSKQVLRRRVQRVNESLSQEQTAASDSSIVQNILQLPEYRSAQTVFCFVGRGDEVNTRPVIEHSLASGKRVGVPLVVSSESMEVREIKDMAQLQQGKFGILEPSADSALIHQKEIDIALIPCVSCDRDGNRLGHGGGYYDRYLASTDFIKAVVCREVLLSLHVPAEPWDVHADMLITDSGVKYFSSKQ